MTDKRRRLAALAATAVVLSLAAVACVPVPVQVVTPTVPTLIAPPATATPTVLSPIPGQPPDQEPPLVEVLAPIDEVVILGVDSVPPEISLSVVSGLPNSCARFDRRGCSRWRHLPGDDCQCGTGGSDVCGCLWHCYSSNPTGW